MQSIAITTIIPAHNEAHNIADTIQSLRKQVDRIIVACDRCTDDTAQIAQSTGADIVFKTVNNTGRKAGSINQALTKYVDLNQPNLYVMIMDADTQIGVDWVAKAQRLVYPYRTEAHAYDAVGSVFQAPQLEQPNVLQTCQRNKWLRYTEKVSRTKHVFVLTGTCSMIRATKLQAVYEKYHRFYSETSITEDFGMTLDLKAVGTRMISPVSIQCTTGIMLSYRDLFKQRRRWYLGALQQIFRRDWDRVLIPYLFQQLMLMLSVVSFALLLLVSVYVYLRGLVTLSLFWLVIFVIFDLERVMSIWPDGPKNRWFAGLLVPELWYAFFLHLCYLGALFQFMTGSKGTLDNHTDS